MAYTTINKSTEHFNARPYVGNGGTLNITGMEFQPNLTWLKCRDIAYYHRLYDVIRGPLKSVRSDTSAVEETRTGEGLTAFNSDGYTVIQGSNTEYNNNNIKYASWNWKANGAGSANTDGSISSTVSVNTTSGFSIVKYVGTGSGSNSTVGHGLGVTPSIIIVKSLDSVTDWVVWNKDLPSQTNNYLRLNTNQAIGTTTNYWNSSAPTNQVFGVSPDGYNNNKSGEDTVAYCFNDVQGFSKFGSYTGNGNAYGPFVYTGFKPAWIMIKRTDGADTWTIYDNKRIGFNVDNNQLFANDVTTESTDDDLDILSNGFKIRRNSGRINTSGANQIYMAFAEAPLVGTNNIPANAR